MRIESISDRFKKIRELENLSQSEFAKKIGISQQICSLIESGKAPSVKVLIRLSELFGINLNWLLLGRGEMFLLPEKNFNRYTEKRKAMEELLKKMNELVRDLE